MTSVHTVKITNYHSNTDILKRNSVDSLNFSKISTSESEPLECSCPKILCCDDEQYQHLIIAKILSSESEDSKIENKIEFFLSGEGLIEKYLKLRSQYSCHGPMYIITDYNMGLECMSGVELIYRLRNFGFEGEIILRTSNHLQSMEHIKLSSDEENSENNRTRYLSKQNLMKQKEMFHEIAQICF